MKTTNTKSLTKFSYFAEVKKGFKFKNYWLYGVLLFAMVICIALGATGLVRRSTILMFEQIGYTMIAVVSLSLVVGFLGELSLGHAAFMSIGAMFGAFFQNTIFPGLSASVPLLSLIIAIIIGGLIAGVFGFIIGLPALRLKGDYLAIVTLAFGEIVKVIFINIPGFGGAIGFSNNFRYNKSTLFIIIFVIAFLIIILCKNLIKSKHGRQIMAIRDNEIAARACGVNVSYYKIFVFTLSAVLAGVAGVLYGATRTQIDPKVFNYNYSINNILLMVIIGGMGNLNGSVIAAIVVTYVDIKLQTVLTGDLAALKNIIYAVILIAIIMYRNIPQLANFREKYNLTKLFDLLKKNYYKKVLKKEYVKNPGEKKEYSAEWSKIPTKVDMDATLSDSFSVSDDNNPEKKGEIK